MANYDTFNQGRAAIEFDRYLVQVYDMTYVRRVQVRYVRTSTHEAVGP
jgi:hypothetical protein